MNNDILKRLTFGAEIEGCFRLGLAKKLNQRGEFKHDGSVRGVDYFDTMEVVNNSPCVDCETARMQRGDRYCRRHYARYGYEGEIAQEYATEICDNLEELLTDLQHFTPDYHHWNNTCGLHLHVGIRSRRWKQLWSATSNYDFIQKLYNEAKQFCRCQSLRLDRNSDYYQWFNGQRDLVRSTKDGHKYRFLNFHNGYHTLEFRFLAPCEHKIENITKTVSLLTDYLGSDVEGQQTADVEIVEAKPEVQNVTRVVDQEPRHINVIEQLYDNPKVPEIGYDRKTVQRHLDQGGHLDDRDKNRYNLRTRITKDTPLVVPVIRQRSWDRVTYGEMARHFRSSPTEYFNQVGF